MIQVDNISFLSHDKIYGLVYTGSYVHCYIFLLLYYSSSNHHHSQNIYSIQGRGQSSDDVLYTGNPCRRMQSLLDLGLLQSKVRVLELQWLHKEEKISTLYPHKWFENNIVVSTMEKVVNCNQSQHSIGLLTLCMYVIKYSFLSTF